MAGRTKRISNKPNPYARHNRMRALYGDAVPADVWENVAKENRAHRRAFCSYQRSRGIIPSETPRGTQVPGVSTPHAVAAAIEADRLRKLAAKAEKPRTQVRTVTRARRRQ